MCIKKEIFKVLKISFFMLDNVEYMWYYVEVFGGVWICLRKRDKIKSMSLYLKITL